MSLRHLREFALELHRAARRGCELCNILQQAVPSPESSNPVFDVGRDILSSLVSRPSARSGTAESLSIVFTYRHFHPAYSPTALACHSLILQTPGFEAAVWTIDSGHQSAVTRTGGAVIKVAERVRTWRHWIDECRETHGACNTTASSSHSFPTRIIDVGVGEDIPRLVEHVLVESPYVALSHLWGFRPPLRTTRENYGSHAAGIPWRQLPRTFRDAMTLTRGLGYRFIWIDSLCIVQDDPDDWEHECGLMVDVYSNAVVTIAAEDSRDSSRGMSMSQEVPSRVQSVSLPSSEGHASCDITFQGPFSRSDSGQHDPYSSCLSMRGWVLQEFILPSRIIHYYKRRVIMRCFEGERFEDSRWTEPHPDDLHFGPGRLRKDMLKTTDPGQLIMRWYDVLSDFSIRKLTRRSDRFAALAGVARLVARSFADQLDSNSVVYLAGLWFHDLVQGLAWVTKIRRDPRHNDTGDLGSPSWSPLNASGIIHFPYGGPPSSNSALDRPEHDIARKPLSGRWVSLVDVVEASVAPPGDESFINVQAGRIVLKGALRPASLHCTRDAQKVTIWHMRIASAGVSLYLSLDHVPSNEIDFINHGKFHALLLGTSSMDASDLLLYMCVREVPGTVPTYRRVGITHDHSEHSPGAPILSTLQSEIQLVTLI